MTIATTLRRGAVLLLVALFGVALPLHAQPALWTPAGIGGGGALALPSFSPYNAGELYVVSPLSALFRTTNLGETWGTVDFRQFQTNGAVGRIQFTSSPAILYSIARKGNATYPVRSLDSGVTWRALPSDPTSGGAYSLWADPASTTRLVLAGFSDVYFSNDGGATFTRKYTFAGATGLHVGGAAFDGVRIFLGTNAGLVRSNDNGVSFSVATTPGIPATQSIVSLAGSKQGASLKLVAVTLGSGNVYAGITGADYNNYRGVYTLDAGGGGWTNRTAALPAGAKPFFAAMGGNNVNVMYVAGGGANGTPTVYKTTDGGASWTSIFRVTNNQNIRTGWQGYQGDRDWGANGYALGLAVSPIDPNKVALTDPGSVHISNDGGGEWKQAYVSTADETPAGATTPTGKPYHSIGMENTACWQVAWADSAHMVAACSDIKAIVSTNGGAAWSLDYAGHDLNSMYRIAIDPSNGALYAATASVHDIYQRSTLTDALIDGGSGRVIVSTDKGHSWSTLHDFGHPVVWVWLDPKNPHTLYASVAHSAEGGIYVSRNIQNGAGSTWTKLAAPPRTEGHPMTIATLDDGTLVCTYSARRTSGFTASSGVFMSADGGNTWVDRSAPGMRYWTKDLVIDPYDPAQNTWYAGVFDESDGASNGHGGLYKTTDRGTSWGKILDVNRVTSCTVSPTDPNEIYATSESGLWYTNNGAADAPVFVQLPAYGFRQPERVFYNPYRPGEVWVTSYGNGMKYGAAFASANPPVAPPLLAPANHAVAAPLAGTFQWGTLTEAIWYQLQLSTTPDFSVIVLDTIGLPGTNLSYGGLAENTKYYWRVRGANTVGNGVWSQTWSFTTLGPSIPPAAPALISPSNDSAGVPLDRSLVWGMVSEAGRYQLQLSTSADFSARLIDTSGLMATSFFYNGLAEKTTYYWRVRGFNSAGTGPWSPAWRFTTLAKPTAPGAPALRLPADGSTNLPLLTTLQWETAAGATSYRLQMSTRADFAKITADTAGLTGLSFTPQNLTIGTTYYWRVSAANAVGEGLWSPTWMFIVRGASSVDVGPETGASPMLRSYPNPASSQAAIVLDLPHAGQARLTIVDALGREVMRPLDGTVARGEHQIGVSVASLPAGTYYCRLEFDGGVRMERMVVVR